MKLLSIKIDDSDLLKSDFSVDENQLIIHNAPNNFILQTVVEINPSANTFLEGLYKSGNVFCTQLRLQDLERLHTIR